MTNEEPITILPIKLGTFVRVIKIAASGNPIAEPAHWNSWKLGECNILSLPLLYEMRGFLLAPIQVGMPIQLYRTHRNGVAADGWFTSTIICAVRDHITVETFNSNYQILPSNPSAS